MLLLPARLPARKHIHSRREHGVARIEFRMGQSLEKIPFGGAVDSIVAVEGMNQQLIQAEFMSWVARDITLLP